MQVNAIIFLESLDQKIHDAQIEIIAAEEGISARGADLKHAFAHIQNGHIEGAAAKVINHDDFVFLFIQAIGKR